MLLIQSNFSDCNKMAEAAPAMNPADEKEYEPPIEITTVSNDLRECGDAIRAEAARSTK